MTATLDLHPDTGRPVLAGVAEIDAALDRMLGDAGTPLASGEHATAVRALERIIRRVEAVKLKMLVSAEQAGAARAAGFSGTDAWTARHTNISRTQAAREVALATDLKTGHDATAAALGHGSLSPEHAAVIVSATRQLPPGVSPAQKATVEASLVAKAARFSPDQLRRIARRAIEAVEPDQGVVDAHENDLVRTDEEAAREKCTLTFHDNQDGTVTGHFTVPTLAAAVLRKVIESMTAPRRMRASTDPGHGSDRAFDWRHRRGLAFAELLEHLPTDHLHPKTAATVVVTIDHTLLLGALRTAGLDSGEIISAGEARRLACGAGILPAVLGSKSVALDLGRENRLFSEPQRLAIGIKHQTCAADGCERPFAWCELHHRQPWHRGGRTDLNQAVPLCHFHHQRIHDHGYQTRSLPDGGISFSRRC